MRGVLVLALALALAASCRTARPERERPAGACELGSPVIVHRDGDAIEQYWELDDAPVLWESVAPASDAYRRFRAQVAARVSDLDPRALLRRTYEGAGAPASEDERKQRHNNREIAEGRVGTLREINCLEAALFAHQTERYSMIERPTEFHGVLVSAGAGDGARHKIYFAASAELFPPKPVHIMERVKRDVAAGWSLAAHIHNHTWHFDPADGSEDTFAVTAPSTPDVQYYRSLRAGLRLERAVVTNGVSSVEIEAAELDALEARE